MKLNRVVVTGLGAVTPVGNTVAATWEAVLAGTSGAGPITKFDASNFKVQFACEVKDFDVSQYLDRKAARRVDLFTQYAIASTDEAIQDAGLVGDDLDRNKIGVIWSSGVGGLQTLEQNYEDYFKAGGLENPRFNPFFIPKMILDIAAGQISIRNDFRGLNFAVVSACASSTNSLIDAYNYLRLGKAKAIVAGGSEAAVSPGGIGGFMAMQALSKRNDDPKTASRPFDKGRNGFVLGEGTAALVLETLEHAQSRGAKIYAEFAGGGMSADAHHITQPHPEGDGAYRVIMDTLEDAGCDPEYIDYINAHGTSTPLGDISEIKAIKRAFGEHAYKLNVSSTKSMTGHLLGAAGALEALICTLSVKHDKIPPTINHFEDDPELDPKINYTFNKAQDKTVRAALCNTFGFGGHNASVILKKFEA